MIDRPPPSRGSWAFAAAGSLLLLTALVANEWVLGGWLTFDGTRAFVVGDYVTPSSGEYAGQLGPWTLLVSAAGLDPRSGVVKGAHVGLGLLWLGTVVAFAARWPRARWLAVVCAILSLWYLPMGTVIGVAMLLLQGMVLRTGRNQRGDTPRL